MSSRQQRGMEGRGSQREELHLVSPDNPSSVDPAAHTGGPTKRDKHCLQTLKGLKPVSWLRRTSASTSCLAVPCWGHGGPHNQISTGLKTLGHMKKAELWTPRLVILPFSGFPPILDFKEGDPSPYYVPYVFL
jgi:hypothetical protein